MKRKLIKFIKSEKWVMGVGFLVACLCISIESYKPISNLITEEQIVTEQLGIVKHEVPNVMSSESDSDIETSGFGVELKSVDAKPVDVVISSHSIPDGEGVCNSAKKTYMGYDAVTSKTSRQYKLLNSDKAWSDPETGLRMYEDRICIAIGQGFGAQIGTKVNLVMYNGSVVRCVVGDFKAIVHTDPTMRYQKYDGSVAEMIVDYTYFEGTHMYPEELKGKILRIDLVE